MDTQFEFRSQSHSVFITTFHVYDATGYEYDTLAIKHATLENSQHLLQSTTTPHRLENHTTTK